MIKLGRKLIRCLELIEESPHSSFPYVSKMAGIDLDQIYGYLSRLTRNGLLVKHRPSRSESPTFTVVSGWRDRVEFRNDIGNPKTITRKLPTKRITPLPMSAGARGLPKRIINSVWALGNL